MLQPVLTVAQMRKLDEFVINRDDTAKTLMGRAGEALAEELKRFAKIAIVCGSGNNGGDGYAATYALQNEGLLENKRVDVYYTKEPKSEESKFFFNSIIHKNAELQLFTSYINLKQYEIIADCLLGTGFSGTPTGVVADAINIINVAREENIKVISMDINSGVNGDTGQATIAVKSDLTLSVGYLKAGMLENSFKEWTKEIKSKNIGYELSPDNLAPFTEKDKIVFKEI